MKMNRIVLPLILALVATVAATGCKKGQPKTIPLPGQTAPVVGDPNGMNTLGNGNTFNPDNSGGGVGSTGGGSTAGLDMFEGMIKDSAALAAHTIHFGFDSAVVKKSEQANIDAVAAALKSNLSNKLLIEGNCDERGTEEYNLALGERRALAAREALVKAGISADRIRTISYGKNKPVDPSNNEAAWAKNRRDDFILLLPKAGI